MLYLAAIFAIDLPGGTAAYGEALGIMLLSGDIPDLMYFQGGDQKTAEQVLAQAEHHSGAFQLAGQMIDAPVITRARLILRRNG